MRGVSNELGYRIDTSISPFQDWSDYGGPDYSDAPTDQYHFNHDRIFSADVKGALLEIPPTIGFFQNNFQRCDWLRKKILSSKLSKLHLIGILDKLKILNFRWLSPELCNGMDMVKLSERFIQKGYRFLNMSFHSTSLISGMTPFVKSETGIDKFIKDIEIFLQYAHDNEFIFVPLDKAAII